MLFQGSSRCEVKVFFCLLDSDIDIVSEVDQVPGRLLVIVFIGGAGVWGQTKDPVVDGRDQDLASSIPLFADKTSDLLSVLEGKEGEDMSEDLWNAESELLLWRSGRWSSGCCVFLGVEQGVSVAF